MSEHIEDYANLYEAARSLRKTGLKMTWSANEISSVLDEMIRLRHIVASGLAVSISQENKSLKAENESLRLACAKVIEMNRQHAMDQYGDAEKAESWSCVTVLRAAMGWADQP